jgi:hypothetical protein
MPRTSSTRCFAFVGEALDAFWRAAAAADRLEESGQLVLPPETEVGAKCDLRDNVLEHDIEPLPASPFCAEEDVMDSADFAPAEFESLAEVLGNEPAAGPSLVEGGTAENGEGGESESDTTNESGESESDTTNESGESEENGTADGSDMVDDDGEANAGDMVIDGEADAADAADSWSQVAVRVTAEAARCLALHGEGESVGAIVPVQAL